MVRLGIFVSIFTLFSIHAFSEESSEPIPVTKESKEYQVSRDCGELIYSMIQIAGLQDEDLKSQIDQSRKGNPLNTDLVTVNSSKLELMAVGFESLFKGVYGESYQPEYLPLVTDKVCRQLRSVTSLYHLTGRAFVPCEVLLGIEEKATRRADRINKLRKEIHNLRLELGSGVEYLTPAALAAVDIFRDVGRSRNLAGGGVREALKPVALAVKDNLDDLFRSLSASSVQDDTLRELLIVVAKLVKYGAINPNQSKAIRAAIHDVVVANLSAFDPYLEEKSFKTLEWLAENPVKKDAHITAALEQFPETILRAKQWQAQARERVAIYARGYYRGRIAYNVLSLMTRPNGYAGIPLGSPMRDALASLESHPTVLSLTLRAYEDSNAYLSLTVGEILKADAPPRVILTRDGVTAADRVLTGRLVTDDKLYCNFQLGYEYELQQVRDLLREEKRARRWNTARSFVAAITGSVGKDAVSKSKFLQTIIPGRLLDALLLQVETGSQAGAAEAAAKFRRRSVQNLPATLKDYLEWDTSIYPWLTTLPPVPRSVTVTAEDEVREQAAEAAATTDAETPAAPASETVPAPAVATATETPAAIRETPSAPSSGSTAERYLWAILKPLEDRAGELLECDHKFQETTQRCHGRLAQEQIQDLAADVSQLLRSTLVVQSAVEASFRAAGLTPEDAEETLAWHLLKRAPTLAMYVVMGPPGPPRVNPPVLTGQAGLAWRIGMMAPRLSYGDGTQDEPIFTTQPESPHGKWRQYRGQIAVAIITAAAIVGGRPLVNMFAEKIGWTGGGQAISVPQESTPTEVKKEGEGGDYTPAPPVNP